jgi:DNA-binding response OmpR family regulator
MNTRASSIPFRLCGEVALSGGREPPGLQGQARQKTILIVDDDQATGEVLEAALAECDASYLPLVAHSAAEAMRLGRERHIDLFILDYLLGEMSGIELYHQLRDASGQQQTSALIMSTSLAVHEPELHAHQLLGLAKPFELDELLQTVAQLLAESREQS